MVKKNGIGILIFVGSHENVWYVVHNEAELSELLI